jgi:hypothetical protein
VGALGGLLRLGRLGRRGGGTPPEAAIDSNPDPRLRRRLDVFVPGARWESPTERGTRALETARAAAADAEQSAPPIDPAAFDAAMAKLAARAARRPGEAKAG